MQRRLQLLKYSKAHVQRRGFSEHCRMIADVEPEMLLKAIALKGEKADIRDVMRDPDADPKLKKALGDVLIATGNIIGMEGHRFQIRNRGHAAGWHYGNATLFVTCVQWDMCSMTHVCKCKEHHHPHPPPPTPSVA